MVFYIFQNGGRTNIEYTQTWQLKIDSLDEIRFSETFRMKRSTFKRLIKHIRERESLTNLETKMYIFLFYVSQSSTYRELREQFGVPKSTVADIITEISAVLKRFCHTDIRLPEENEFSELEAGLRGDCNETGNILCIDGTHIQIRRPVEEGWKYYNRKGTFSLNFVCLVDYKKRFRAFTYNFGSCHDSRIYRNSFFKTFVDGLENYTVLGDPAFSGFRNIKSSYSTTSNPLTNTQLYELGRLRVIVENAFGLLKSKFKKLSKTFINGETEQGIKIIKSIFWLHNFIINHD